MYLFLFQVADSLQKIAATINPLADGYAAPVSKVSLWGLLEKGGWIMYPLYGLLVLALFFFFERYLVIQRANRIDKNFMDIIRDQVLSANLTAAKNYAQNNLTPVSIMISKGLQRIGKPIDAVEKSMENIAKIEMYKLEKNLSILSLIAGIAPMFGFLGTIVGMVQLFYGISNTGEYTLNTIAGGIYTKMVTSASGLIIGLVAFIAYNFLNAQIDKTSHRLEAASADFLDLIQEPTKQ